MSSPAVSVCIITYQHVRFIARTIDGALAQKTTFPFEIVIGEDESTDGTRAICQDYARRHPGKIRLILRQRKDVILVDGRPRGSYNFRQTVAATRGEFVALCEGDDFWTDPTKLQRQVDYLHAHADCVGCFHDAKLVDAHETTIQESYFQSPQSKFDQHDVLDTLMSRYPTCSLMFRKSAYEPLPEWYLRRPCDLYLDLVLTGKGRLGFIDRNMAAYRKHAGGIWSGERESNQVIELIVRYKLLLADAFFLETYKDLLVRKIEEFQDSLFTRSDFGREVGRLEQITHDQARHIQVLEQERKRLESERGTIKQHLDQLAATAQQQGVYIATLERLRDRSVSEGQHLVQTLAESQRVMDQLKAQLDQLAATSREQDHYIATLKTEVDRLTQSAAQLAAHDAHYVRVIEEQTEYIRLLEQQRKSGAPNVGS